MNAYDHPVLPPKTCSEVFAEIKRVVRTTAGSGWNPPPDWTHLSVPHSVPAETHPEIKPSGHFAGHWETTYVRMHPHVENALKSHVFTPVFGLELIPMHDGTLRLVATGAHCIGGCTVCLIKPEVV